MRIEEGYSQCIHSLSYSVPMSDAWVAVLQDTHLSDSGDTQEPVFIQNVAVVLGGVSSAHVIPVFPVQTIQQHVLWKLGTNSVGSVFLVSHCLEIMKRVMFSPLLLLLDYAPNHHPHTQHIHQGQLQSMNLDYQVQICENLRKFSLLIKMSFQLLSLIIWTMAATCNNPKAYLLQAFLSDWFINLYILI